MSVNGWDTAVVECVGAMDDDDLGWPCRRGGRCDGR